MPEGGASYNGSGCKPVDDGVIGVLAATNAQALAASIAANGPRVLALSAPPGYGKGLFLRAYAARIGDLIVCDLSGGGGDPARPVLDALVANDRGRAARSSGDRLAQRRELAFSTSREALRREWPRSERPELFALRDIDGALATPAGADVFDELVGTLPGSRVLAVSMRRAFPPALLQSASREQVVTLGAAELALGPDDVERIAAAAGSPPGAGTVIHRITGGWPLVSELLSRLARGDAAPEVLEAAELLPQTSLLAFAVHRTIARLDEPVREALVVAALLHGAAHPDLMRVLGDACDDVVFAKLCALPFVLREDTRAVVHDEITSVLRERFGALVKSLYERTLHVLTGDGAYVEAARVALDGGDVLRAAAIVDAVPPYTAASLPLGIYERVIDRIDRDVITSYPNLWIATIPYRSFAVDRATFVREAETVYYCLPHGTNADQRAAALMHLANGYTNAGRVAEADELLDEALHGFAAEPSLARASLLNFSASLRGMEGRFAAARARADEAADMPRHRFGENQTLQYIEAHEAAFRGQNDRIVVIFDELLRRLKDAELPTIRAHTATNGALFTWVNGDDASFQRYLAVLEDALTPGIERGFAPMIDAVRGRSMQLDEGYPWPVVAAVAQLYRLGTVAAEADALDAAHAAVRAADQSHDSYVRILAHVALYVLDESGRTRESQVLDGIIASIESPEMHAAVRALVRGERPGILERFVNLRVLGEREHAKPRLSVELLAGRVTRDGVPVRLTEKEFELLALLGSTHGALTRDRIGEALWDHLDPEEWPNNLKVTLSRVRSKLGVHDAVIVADGRYRLSAMIDVDLRRAEAAVREYASGVRPDVDGRNELQAILSGYRSGGTGRYERFVWMQPLLSRINDVAGSAGAALAADALARERFDEALAYARDVAAIDPLNEGACEAAVRVLLARGETDAARREFRRYATALAEELGATPSARLVELLRTTG